MFQMTGYKLSTEKITVKYGRKPWEKTEEFNTYEEAVKFQQRHPHSVLSAHVVPITKV